MDRFCTRVAVLAVILGLVLVLSAEAATLSLS